MATWFFFLKKQYIFLSFRLRLLSSYSQHFGRSILRHMYHVELSSSLRTIKPNLLFNHAWVDCSNSINYNYCKNYSLFTSSWDWTSNFQKISLRRIFQTNVNQELSLWIRVELGTKPMKGYTAFPEALKSETSPQDFFNVISRILVGEVLPFCRDAVSVSSS